MTYGNPVCIYAHTWYHPSPMSMRELKARAMQRLINMYDAAMDNDNDHLIRLFDNELGHMSQEAQSQERQHDQS